MKRHKPDLMWVLILVLGLGVALSSVSGQREAELPSVSLGSNP